MKVRVTVGGNGGIRVLGAAHEHQERVDASVEKVRVQIDRALRASGIHPRWSCGQWEDLRYPEGWVVTPNLHPHEVPKAGVIVHRLLELAGWDDVQDKEDV